MELRDFFGIFVDHKKVFFGIILCSVTIGIIFFFIQPKSVKTTLTLNVTRDQRAQLNEYAYDDFYRLQADERFADTVVQWISEPFFAVAVFDPENARRVSAKRLSSQVITVTYRTTSVSQAQRVAQAVVDQINVQTESLNQRQMQEGWFIVIGADPVIVRALYPFPFLVGLSFLIGAFVGFWAVMIIHYLIGDVVKK